MTEKQTEAAVVQVAVVTRKLFQSKPVRGGAVPLFRVSLQLFFERDAKRLEKGCNRTVLRITECQSHGELALTIEVNFSHQGNVSVRGLIELPVHLKVSGEIGPAVTPANVTT